MKRLLKTLAVVALTVTVASVAFWAGLKLVVKRIVVQSVGDMGLSLSDVQLTMDLRGNVTVTANGSYANPPGFRQAPLLRASGMECTMSLWRQSLSREIIDEFAVRHVDLQIEVRSPGDMNFRPFHDAVRRHFARKNTHIGKVAVETGTVGIRNAGKERAAVTAAISGRAVDVLDGLAYDIKVVGDPVPAEGLADLIFAIPTPGFRGLSLGGSLRFSGRLTRGGKSGDIPANTDAFEGEAVLNDVQVTIPDLGMRIENISGALPILKCLTEKKTEFSKEGYPSLPPEKNLSVGALIVRDVSLRNIAGKLRYFKDVIWAGDISFTCCQGKGVLKELNLDPREGKMLYIMSGGEIRGLDLADLARENPDLSGNFSGRIDIRFDQIVGVGFEPLVVCVGFELRSDGPGVLSAAVLKREEFASKMDAPSRTALSMATDYRYESMLVTVANKRVVLNSGEKGQLLLADVQIVGKQPPTPILLKNIPVWTLFFKHGSGGEEK